MQITVMGALAGSAVVIAIRSILDLPAALTAMADGPANYSNVKIYRSRQRPAVYGEERNACLFLKEPFVFLDHIAPAIQTKVNKEGTGAHPHRGIATLSYILNDEDEHFDSAGNYAMVHSGGVQWMNAGNGIIHDETLNYDSRTDSKLTHAFQFWINLPSAIKAGKPAYLAIEGNEVPYKELPDGKGWIKVIAGSFEELISSIPSYSEQFIYHLEPGAGFAANFADKSEVAAFLPVMPASINDEKFDAGEFIEFDRNAGSIALLNGNREAADVILFGGEPYQEPIVAEGPFVMNSMLEIADAYRDFHTGKYGKIDYEKQKLKA